MSTPKKNPTTVESGPTGLQPPGSVQIAEIPDRSSNGAAHPKSSSVALSPVQAFSLVFILVACLAAFALLDPVRDSPRLWWSFTGTAALLIVWNLVLLVAGRIQKRSSSIETVLRPQAMVQACAHLSIFIYWGWFSREVYGRFYLVVAQLLFAYIFEILLSWCRREPFALGFGPFPIIFSTNLFLLFKPDWFYLQFIMLAFAFTAKKVIRWHKDGRLTHIFNPSALPLAVFSIYLLLTQRTDITWGNEIAITQAYPPHMYLFLFLAGLPGQFLFGVATMTMSAALTTYLFGLAYFAATGVYFFYDCYIPVAVFLGMLFLFTDPSTSPRTELGRIFFGVLYGFGVVILFAVLKSFDLPRFYDKLLPVPLLNVSILLIDRLAKSKWLRWINPSELGRSLAKRQRNLAYMLIWAIVFAGMSAAQGVGDEHPGQWLPFWQQACDAGRPSACPYVMNLKSNFCDLGSGWACNELGVSEAQRNLNHAEVEEFQKGCRLGFVPACINLSEAPRGSAALRREPPTLKDFPIVLRGNKGPITTRDPAALYQLACKERWPSTCEGTRGAGSDH